MKSRSLSSRACGWRLILVAALVLVLCSSALVLQNNAALAQSANPSRELPDAAVERGETFDVTVTFTAPEDDFNAIGLVDNVPSGWAIQVDKTWCIPAADQHNIVGDQAQYVWYGPYNAGETFTALYKVTVPGDAALTSYPFDGELGYKIGGGDRIFETIGGDLQVTVEPFPTPTLDLPNITFNVKGSIHKVCIVWDPGLIAQASIDWWLDAGVNLGVDDVTVISPSGPNPYSGGVPYGETIKTKDTIDNVHCIEIRSMMRGDIHIFVKISLADGPEWTLHAEKKWGELGRTELDVNPDLHGVQHTEEVSVPVTATGKHEEVITDMVNATFLGFVGEVPAGHATVHWWLFEDTDANQKFIDDLMDYLASSHGGALDDDYWAAHGSYWMFDPFLGGKAPWDYINDYALTHHADTAIFDWNAINPASPGAIWSPGWYAWNESEGYLPGETPGRAQATLTVDLDKLVPCEEEKIMIVILVSYPGGNTPQDDPYHGENSVCVAKGKKRFHKISVNNPPNTPSNPSPSNHATGVSIYTDLSWTGGDPDAGDTVTYDVYFGTSASPPLVSNDQSGTTYDPGTLADDTKYYWNIVAADNHGASTPGPLWDFTTEEVTTDLNPHFVVDKIEVAVGEVVTFDPTPTAGGTLPYTRARWDFDGDGVWDEDSDVTGKNSMSTVTYAYPEEGTYSPCLEITDSSIPRVWRIECRMFFITVTAEENNPPNTPTSPSPSNHATAVSIYTDLSWTGGDPDAGDTVQITATGYIQVDSAGRMADPDGQPDGDLGVGSMSSLVPSAPQHTLVGRIGSSGSLTDLSGFLVGSDYSETASESGRLFLGFNDGFVKPDRTGLDSGGVGDNSGSFTAQITITESTGFTVSSTTAWQDTGLDVQAGDTVTYDVYFGTSSTPPLVSNDQPGTTYDPGTLAGCTKYYWNIVATDNHGVSTPGPLWDFTTQLCELNPDFAGAPREGTAPLQVTFDPAASYCGVSPCVKVEWDFDNDGIIDEKVEGSWATPADIPTATYTYTAPGLYTVSLTITDSTPPPVGPLVRTEKKFNYITVVDPGILPDAPSPEAGLGSIADELIIAYHYAGFGVWDVYWPEFGIDTIGVLEVGKIYLIYVDSDCTLQYGAHSYELNGPDWNFIYWFGQ